MEESIWTTREAKPQAWLTFGSFVVLLEEKGEKKLKRALSSTLIISLKDRKYLENWSILHTLANAYLKFSSESRVWRWYKILW